MSERRRPPALIVPSPPRSADHDPETRRWMDDVTRLLQKMTRFQYAGVESLPAPHGSQHDYDGNDPLTAAAPSAITLANTAGTPAAGDGPEWALADHSHGSIKRDVRVAKAGVDVGTRNRLNFIEGTGVAITAADDSVNDEVDITLAWDPGDVLTTTGDVLYRGSGGVTRRPAGSYGYVYFETAGEQEAWPAGQYWGYEDLTDNVAATVVSFTSSDLAVIHQQWGYTVVCVNAANAMQFETGTVLVTGRNPVGGDPVVTVTKTAGPTHADSGTLTVTFAGTVSGNTVNIRCTADTSLTPTALYCQFGLITKVDDTTLTY